MVRGGRDKRAIADEARELEHCQTQVVWGRVARVQVALTATPALSLLISKAVAEQLPLPAQRRHRVEGVQVGLRCVALQMSLV